MLARSLMPLANSLTPPTWLAEILVSVWIAATTITVFAAAVAFGIFVAIKTSEGNPWIAAAAAAGCSPSRGSASRSQAVFTPKDLAPVQITNNGVGRLEK